jgi:uncharacterized damage-inducible protein DinB
VRNFATLPESSGKADSRRSGMYATVADFLEDWKYESEATTKILERLTDDSLARRVHGEGRTLGFLAWHVALTPVEMLSRSGIAFRELDEDAPLPATAAEIAATYRSVAAAVAQQVSAWNDSSLSEEHDMYGERWTKRMVLLSLVKHQIHHRAQMTVLMRQAGLAVPGVYGPAKEEWTAYGMDAPE